MVKILNFRTIIEQDEDGYFVASVPSVPGCYSQGKTYEEVVGNVKEALELCLEEAKENPTYAKRISYPEDKSKEKFLGIVDLPVRVAI